MDEGSYADIGSLKQLSIDELMNVEVTSVSKTTEPYRDAAAALTVVTGEHLRRSGATAVPDALRWVPGLHVARRNASTWAVSSRGFSSVNSEKLLVLSDTRSIYTPLFSGVPWDVQDYLLADIDRIEVIRGPGAALWGSNAVNGVINITTKHAADTHGTYLEAVTGTEERATLAVRHGDQTRGGVHYRVFGKFSERDETFHASSHSDDWRLGHLGFRTDWAPTVEDAFTVQGDAYYGTAGQLGPAVSIIGRPGPTGPLEAQVAGGNLLGRWRHATGDDSELQLRAYYDRTHRDDPTYTDDLHTVDLDLQHRFRPLRRHEVVWGANYRYTSNKNVGKGVFALRPLSSDDQLFSAFVQDQIVWRDRVRVTLGTKAEHNDFSGFELQPSVRAAWEITPKHTVWAAVSRAARIPTRLERDVFIDASDPAGNPILRLLGNDDFDAEELVAYEVGFRWRATDRLFIDLALFENQYDGLASLEIGDPFVDPADGRTVIPVLNRNLTDGEAEGVETHVTYSVLPGWRLSASYSYLNLRLDPAGQDLNGGELYEGATPQHQFALSSYLTLPGGLELDAHFRSQGAIHEMAADAPEAAIPHYNELDVHLSWLATERVRITVVGQNLLHDHHLEFGTPETRGQIERGVYAKVAWEL